MRLIQKINGFVALAETYILVFVVLVMVVFSFAQVILRGFFDQGILWGDIFLRHLVLWVGFIGASIASREEKHINIDVFGRMMKGRYKPISQGLVYSFATFVSYLLMSASWAFVMDEKEYETILFGDIASWYFQIIIPIGFGLMFIRFGLHAIEKLINGVIYKAGETK
ncbi:MAG: TRAP transporter small permease [Calditrichaeota bacterium]|nr:MAG: TRAP transporter small permease [Calditrichota bacterium]MBL1204851.1 TRAP transporter small permease [Calditrichota bacterium]NOG44680.1 TRAP transporter small permease [Calditrichota bacterium]